MTPLYFHFFFLSMGDITYSLTSTLICTTHSILLQGRFQPVEPLDRMPVTEFAMWHLRIKLRKNPMTDTNASPKSIVQVEHFWAKWKDVQAGNGTQKNLWFKVPILFQLRYLRQHNSLKASFGNSIWIVGPVDSSTGCHAVYRAFVGKFSTRMTSLPIHRAVFQ